MPAKIDYAGQVYGRWTVIKYVCPARGSSLWLCRCSCGTERKVRINNLRTGTSTSCGCFSNERLIERVQTHGSTVGHKVTPEYRSWQALKTRCLNPHAKNYDDYGGRGITVSLRWLGPNGFANFLEDVGVRPSQRHSLDRINNDGNYEPGNVRWATATEQAANRRVKRIEDFSDEQLLIELHRRELLAVEG